MQGKYIIVSKQRGAANRPVEHDGLERAETEAKRLASASPGDVFTIYRSIRTVSVPDRFLVFDLEDPEDLPF